MPFNDKFDDALSETFKSFDGMTKDEKKVLFGRIQKLATTLSGKVHKKGCRNSRFCPARCKCKPKLDLRTAMIWRVAQKISACEHAINKIIHLNPKNYIGSVFPEIKKNYDDLFKMQVKTTLLMITDYRLALTLHVEKYQCTCDMFIYAYYALCCAISAFNSGKFGSYYRKIQNIPRGKA